MSILSEFREFAVKGNVIDLAVGVIIGAAFGKIVTSLTEDILNPILGFIGGQTPAGVKDLGNQFFALSATHYDSIAEAKKAGVATINYGAFLNNIIQFLIMAFIIFLMVKGLNRMRSQWATVTAAPKAPPQEEVLLTEIRDLLQAQRDDSPKA